MELDRRKMKILSAIVSEYIQTGEPVGSNGWRNCWIRRCPRRPAEMKCPLLFDLGLLEQPHTSAGENPVPFGVSGLPRQAVDL